MPRIIFFTIDYNTNFLLPLKKYPVPMKDQIVQLFVLGDRKGNTAKKWLRRCRSPSQPNFLLLYTRFITEQTLYCHQKTEY